MNHLKVILIALISVITLGTINAKTESEHAVITQSDDNKITLRANADTDHPLRIEFTNKNGEVVFTDEIFSNGLVLKTYDFSETKIGEYQVSVYCKENNFETAFISRDGVNLAASHNLYIK